MKNFTVTLQIEAPNKEAVEQMIDSMSHADRIWDDKIVDEDDPVLYGRIRYVENWNNLGEHYLFESKWSNEEDWGLDTAFRLLDYKDSKGEVLSYQALTKIREWQRLRIQFYFE